jgi:hypothetical protein
MRLPASISLCFALVLLHVPAATARPSVPPSVAAFLSALDALAKADERPEGISVDANIARIKPLLQQVVDAETNTNRIDLNAIYPGLGDHFVDEAAAHARFVLKAIDGQDDDALTRAAATILNWQKWWNANKTNVQSTIFNKYG